MPADLSFRKKRMATIDGKPRGLPLYKQIAESLREEIRNSGAASQYKLPSDSELSVRFNTSRLTIIKSLRYLEAEGLLRRRAGSGTYVNAPSEVSHTFGLLIPDLGAGEIFEPICQGMARAGQSSQQALLWGNTSEAADTKAKRTQELCRYFINKKVAGVFFAPLEMDQQQQEVNREVVLQLRQADIPIVFLDRTIAPMWEKLEHDLVGIDNWKEGFRMADHLLRLGAQRVGFVVRPGSAPTTESRIAGLHEALRIRGIPMNPSWILRADPSDRAMVGKWCDAVHPDGIVCANDFTAAQAMRSLLDLGIGIPEQVRIVGFDDVKYASLLPVPLTTLRQPCQEIGAAAINVMLERLSQPNMAPRSIALACEVVVRQSCGGLVAGVLTDAESSAFTQVMEAVL